MSELFYLPFPTAFSSNGLPVPGAKAFFYLSGTSTPQAIYSDSALTIERTNPVIANSAGRFPETYLDASKVYRVVVLDSEGGSLNIDIDPYFAGATAITEFMFIQSGTGATPLDSQSKMRQVRAVGDFTTPAVADANNETLFVPADTASTVATGAALAANYWGPGQVETADGNKHGKWFTSVKDAPSALGDFDSINTAFNGDWTHSHFVIEHRISGAATLGNPTTGYRYTPEASAFVGYVLNQSGHNQSTSGNDGRTSANFAYIKMDNYGGGDCAAFSIQGFVSDAGAPVGATSFLAMPAVTMLNGTQTLGSDGCYLNPIELDLQMNGKDGAAVGVVVNINRTVGDTPAGLGAYTAGFRPQSTGSYACDVAYSMTGLWKRGLDTVLADLGAQQVAIGMKANQRIYGNNYATGVVYGDGVNGDWLEYSSAITGWNFVVSGNSRLQLSNALASFVGIPVLAQSLRANGATPTVTAGQIGFGTSTDTSATGGAAAALPALPLGYLVVNLGGTSIKLPYYAA